jgi:hypothetical protein
MTDSDHDRGDDHRGNRRHLACGDLTVNRIGFGATNRDSGSS